MRNDPLEVLLIESQDDDYQLIRLLLTRTHRTPLTVHRAHDIASLEYALASRNYDVCLIEDRLGEQGGYEILAGSERRPLLVLTDREDYQPGPEALRAGAVDYLVKGQLSAALLERTLDNALEGVPRATMSAGMSAQNAPLSAAIANLSVGVLITDPTLPDNPLVFINPAFCAITGYAADEVLGRNPRFLAHPDSDPDVLQAIRDAIEERRLFKGVMLNRRKDGTLYHNELVICPVIDGQGTLVNFVGLTEDVTAQVEALEALQQSEKRYEAMVANVPGLIYRSRRHADGGAEFLYVSPGCRDLLGIEPEALRADASLLRRLVHPEDLSSYEAAASIANGQHQPWRWEGRFVLPSGTEKTILGLGRPDPQENGDLIWDGLLMDVTDRVHAQQKMAQLAAIVESSSDAIYGKTLEGIVTSWNGAAETMYGYTAEEMIGQPITLLSPPDRPSEIGILLEQIARGEPVRTYETLRRAKDGTLLDVALTISPIRERSRGGQIRGASTIAHDIRRRKEAEAQFERQMQRIQALRNIDMAITGSLDLRVTLNILLDQVTTHLHVDSAAVLLLNPHTQRLEYTAGRGFRTSAIQRTDLRIGEGYAGRAALERRVVNVADLGQNPGEFVRGAILAREEFVAYWAVPLITKGRVEGILEVFHRTPLPVDCNWQGFLETLAGQAAIAIENAALFDNLQRTNVDLEIAYDSTLEGWSKALDLRDEETEGHTLRVTEGTMTLARAMNLRDDLIHIRRGALLHDIGKMGVPDAILRKPGPLTEQEWSIMKLHPVYAFQWLSPIRFLRNALDIPYCHHEKWDGSGYPRGLQGEQIPLAARIFAVVDVWDALSSTRPYRQTWPADRVREHIAGSSGTHFDPNVVEVFLKTEL